MKQTLIRAAALGMLLLPIAGASAMTMVAQSNLAMGSRGDDVSSLQMFLESKGFLAMPQGAAHGYFGGLTRSALIRYQSSVGIRATGFYGPLTRGAMANDSSMSMNTSAGVMVGGASSVSFSARRSG
jgi:peptidoglycan hydrolase-like protein with peptidoglycan-binding domain